MRLEWGDAIRYHRWDALEWLAKRDPSQDLCDTVFELATGIENKDEKKMLKKTLFLLKQRGFRPSILIEDSGPARPHLPQGCHAYMTMPVSALITGIWFNNPLPRGAQQTMWWISDYRREIFTQERFIQKRYAHWLMLTDAPKINGDGEWITPLDPAYALGRIARAYERRDPAGCTFEHLHKTYARIFPLAVELPHPAIDYPVAKLRTPDLKDACGQIPNLRDWDLHFPADHEIRDLACSAYWDPLLSEEKRFDIVRSALEEWLVETFTDEGLTAYANACLDLAYGIANREEHAHWTATVMAIRENYLRLGPKAALCDHVMDNTTRKIMAESSAEEDIAIAA